MRHRLPLLFLAALAAAACNATTGVCPLLTQAALQDNPCPPKPPVCTVPSPLPGYPFKNLVLKGGGVKGIAYAGAFAQLDAQHILPNVDRVAGTSAGAITAALVALRYTPQEIRAIVFQLDFKRFEDGGSTGLFRLLERFGFYRGDYFLHLMRCLVEARTHNPRATFADLHAGGFRDLHVFATDLSTGQPKEFSFATTPTVEVARAIRMSMSIPLFFASVEFQRDVFVDGGVLLNYPIDTFDRQGGGPAINPATLGLFLTSGPPPRVPVDGIVTYARQLFTTLLDAQDVDLQTNPADLDRSALIDDLGIPATDFGLTDAQKCALIAEGTECTCRYLNDWRAWQAAGHSPSASLPPLGRATRIDTTSKCGSAWSPP